MISREGIKGNEASFLYDPSNIVDVSELVEILLDGKLSFLNQINLLDLSVGQAPKHLSDRYVRLVSFVVKPSHQHGIGFTCFAQRLFATLTRGRVMNLRIGSQDVVALISFAATRLAGRDVVVPYPVGYQKGQQSIDNGGLSGTVSTSDHGSPAIRVHGVDFIMESPPIKKGQFVQAVTRCRLVR